jgi:hypothetical protein
MFPDRLNEFSFAVPRQHNILQLIYIALVNHLMTDVICSDDSSRLANELVC